MNSDMSIQGEQIAREVEKIFIDYSISRQRFHDMLKTYAQADQDVWIWGEARRRKQRRTGQHTTEEEKRLSYYALLTAVHDHYLPDEPRIIAPDLLELDESARLDSLLALPAGLESRLADAQLALKYVKADLGADTPSASAGQGENAIEYSKPLAMKHWATIFGVGKNKMRELRDSDKYHFKQISDRKWVLPKNELPAEYLEKYRKTFR